MTYDQWANEYKRRINALLLDDTHAAWFSALQRTCKVYEYYDRGNRCWEALGPINVLLNQATAEGD
jgi:hypothetical protein